MSLLAEIARDVATEVRATLPSREEEIGPFIAGMAWALLIYVVVLFVTSYCALRLHGATP